MWLLPILSQLSWLLARIYYRLTVAGEPAPRRGSAILVANHNNALLDPVLVTVAARRPVRFLAKAPLFTDSAVRALIRASGAIPVYRRMDDASLAGRNVEMFQAALQALEGGAAVGLFPEGLSHSGPSLEPLRTGAARMALGAFAATGAAFPIIPVGLVLRSKETFRSEALVILGAKLEWDDLASRGADDREAVRELTERIEAALRKVTLNLERWEDRPLVECAEAIWTAEHGGDADPAAAVARMERATRILGRIRRSGGEGRWPDLVRQVDRHRRRLRALGLHPSHLGRDTRLQAGVRWAARRLHLLGIPAAVLAVAGYVLFRVPYHITGTLARAGGPQRDQVSTYQIIVGVPVYTLWVLGLSVAVAWRWGLWLGAAASILIPAVGLVGLGVRERWRDVWRDVRSFFLMRSRRRQVAGLRERQESLATQLKELYESHREAI
jgi:1-acyl-sn-glycerol-3-phosphate acyltransferase